MLSPSWPAPERPPRRLSSPRVRRRVAAAQRRGLRAAVTFGGSVIAVVIALDATYMALTHGAIGARVAAIGLLELAGVGVVIVLARRRAVRVEALAMSLVLLVYGMTLLTVSLLPDTAILGASYLAVILVGSGLFLPWSSRWHGAWLAAALAVTAVVLAAFPDTVALDDGRGMLAGGAVLAAGVSFFGHRLWQVRLRNMLEQQFALREMSRYAQRQEAHVRTLNLELNRVVRRDPLTGVGNRLALGEALTRLLDQGDRLRPLRFALVLFDIDDFKPYNDQHGHLAGDAALGRLGRTLRRAVRGDDLAFRYGGEEFLLLLPDVDLPDALAIADRVRVAVADDRSGDIPPFTVSGGVALCDPADGRDPAPLLRRADAALYEAKRRGRNQIAADDLSIAMQRESFSSTA